MYRGTTPTIAIKLNTDIKLESLKQIWVTFDKGRLLQNRLMM